MHLVTRPSLALLSGAAVLLLASAAFAHPVEIEEDAPGFPHRRTEVDVGFTVGGLGIGDVGVTPIGLHLGVFRHLNGIGLGASYDITSASETGLGEDRVSGMFQRGSLLMRYSLFEVGSGRPAFGGAWIEGGIGMQRMDWNQGGRLTRRDAALGLGFDVNFVVNRHKKPRTIGVRYALRFLMADPPEGGPMREPGCAGPCDEATTGNSRDLGVLFTMGVAYGR